MLLEIVADKTGYPADMLELDMRLDTDLGIDSIKRVEIFSAIHDRLPESPPAGPEQLGALGTLREIVAFLGSADQSTGHALPLDRIRPWPSRGRCWKPWPTRRISHRHARARHAARYRLGIDSIKRVEILRRCRNGSRAGSISPSNWDASNASQIVEARRPGPPHAAGRTVPMAPINGLRSGRSTRSAASNIRPIDSVVGQASSR